MSTGCCRHSYDLLASYFLHHHYGLSYKHTHTHTHTHKVITQYNYWVSPFPTLCFPTMHFRSSCVFQFRIFSRPSKLHSALGVTLDVSHQSMRVQYAVHGRVTNKNNAIHTATRILPYTWPAIRSLALKCLYTRLTLTAVCSS